MTMEVTRKRPLEEPDSTVSSKKRALVAKIEPKVESNGAEMGAAPGEDDNLESFRKEAIYRRMKHYSRQCDRANLTIAEVERDRAKCNAALVAMEACWTLLVERLRFLIQRDSSIVQKSVESSLFDLSFSQDLDSLDEELSKALQNKSRATEELWETLLSNASSFSRDSEDIKQDWQRLHTDNVALRAQVTLLRKDTSDATAALQESREHAASIEDRLERAKRNDLRRPPPTTQDFTSLKNASPPPDQPLGTVAPQINQEPSESSSDPQLVNSSSDPIDEVMKESLEQWKIVAEAREATLIALTNQIHDLQSENRKLHLQVAEPEDGTVENTAHYKTLLEKACAVSATCEDLRKKAEHLEQELEHLRSTRKSFLDQVNADATAKIEELKAQLLKRDHDNNRVRLERDKIQAELHEKTSRLDALSTGYQHSKSLTTARHERIKTLTSENLRLRAGIAAGAGDEDLYKLLAEGPSDLTLVEILRKENRSLKAQVQALENTLNELSPSNDQKKRIDANAALADALNRISKYEALLGAEHGDAKALVNRLGAKEAELKTLRLCLQEKELEINNQQSSLDQLASSWDTLNDKIDSKLTEAWAWEDKISKSAIEKAKAENKYFSAMRARDTADAERKHAVRNLEKQTKLSEKLVESEKDLQLQLMTQEKERNQLQELVSECKEKINTLETEVKGGNVRGDQSERRYTETSRLVAKLESELREKSTSVRKMEEEVLRIKKQLEQSHAKAKSAISMPGTASGKDAALQDEVSKLMTMLKCSTCKQQMRSHILIKCLHTFCKSCIDARVSTRQRKCPFCNLQFAQSEVQPVWFQ